MKHIIFALALVGCAATQEAQTPAPPIVTTAPVIAAEHAFAARASEAGWVTAFREYTAPDGLLAQPDGFVNAAESLADTPDDGLRTLYWQPDFAGIARSGDLGFTTGPVSFDDARTPRMTYFTVWRKQADGSWKWIYDGGPGVTSDPGPFPLTATDVRSLGVAQAGATDAAGAIAQVQALERGATAGSLASHLAADARVYRTRLPRAHDAAAAAAMAQPAAAMTYNIVRTEASAAGDMVFTLGETNWTEGGAAKRGLFARIWQHRADGWRIVYDQVVLPPPAPPPAAQ